MIKTSVVIPVYNEELSLTPLVDRLIPALGDFGPHEIIFINDGSHDGTARMLDELQAEHASVIKVIHLRRNCGKSIALQAGFSVSSGGIIVMMDGDLQDQPEEIGTLIGPIEKGCLDAVTGWKAHRQDPVTKTLPSYFFNLIMQRLAGLKIHDFNSGFKAFRRECLESFSLYGQMHRFILVFIHNSGYRVGEVKVKHAPRLFGHSKFSIGRIYHGFMDILSVFFITRYLESPLYFFGMYGLAAIVVSIPVGILFLVMHFLFVFNIYGTPLWRLTEHPLWITSPFLFITGLIMIFFGLIGELITYHQMTPFASKIPVDRQVGFDPETDKTPASHE